jgi:ribosomal protein L12E/L44/L45/RPP1/RPP2
MAGTHKVLGSVSSNGERKQRGGEREKRGKKEEAKEEEEEEVRERKIIFTFLPTRLWSSLAVKL